MELIPQSLKQKIPELSHLIRKNNYHIILISETWLNKKIKKKGVQLLKICDNKAFKIQGPNGHTLFPTKGVPSTVDFVIS